ncbi:DUF7146 domain-containing protein [Citreimonas sp.]|uniref:DUF7146 domain-containing protein n=1 Tax=Citreimonas sp. TaxID=3036715 RepID=UPI004059EF5B
MAEAKAIPMREIVDRLGIARLRPNGQELTGPCPLCSGRDRFNVNLRTNAFLCRRCDIRGGDQVALVQAVLGCDFKAALAFLCGDAPAQIDPAEIERRRRRAEAAERKQRDDADRYRRRAIADARSIWSRAVPATGTLVRDYLRARGISASDLPSVPAALRFLPDHPCVKKVGRELVTLHRGPCMIAGVMDPPGRVVAVHQTWIDPVPPHGKMKIAVPEDDSISKLVRGANKGNAIRLVTPERFDVLVMGEGIETTLSAWVGSPIEGAAWWAGVSLGNMAGKARRVPGQRWHGLPDLDDADAFVPPPWVRRLIFLMDGDSDPRATRHKLECGLRRAMARIPGLKAQIVRAGDGVDFNDVLVRKGADHG